MLLHEQGDRWHAEDRWFWIFLSLSLLLHFAVLRAHRVELPVSPARAPSKAFEVSLIKTAPAKEPLQKPNAKPHLPARPQLHRKPIRHTAPAKPAQHDKPVKPVLHKTVVQPEPVVQRTAVTASQLALQQQAGAAKARQVAQQQYLAKILAHIESYKFYPRVAQRRGLSGTISISFELLADGRIRSLSVTGGPLLLRHAAEQSMQQALPLPRPAPEWPTPMSVSLAMSYQMDTN